MARSNRTRSNPLRRYCTLSLSLLEDRSVPSISGLVFQDFNANGVKDTGPGVANDRGVSGVTVSAFDASGALAATATSDANGLYTLGVSNAGAYRVEFTNLPTGVFFGPQGTQVGSAVQFVNNGATNVNLAVSRPEDFSPNNANVVTNQYWIGGSNGFPTNQGSPTIISTNYSAGAPDSDPVLGNHQAGTHTLNVPVSDVGTTYGLAYSPSANTLYASAFYKRTANFGPAGPGGIYAVNMAGNSGTILLDLNQYFPGAAGVIGSNFTDYDGRPRNAPGYDWFTDGLVNDGTRDVGWDAAGKLGFGGMAISADGSRLFTVALGDRRLYSIPTDGSANASTIFAYSLPTPASLNGNPADLRPFAVEMHRGILYIGAVNSAESTGNANDLRAYVFAFDPARGQFIDQERRNTTTQPVLEFALNYPRGHVHYLDNATAAWNAWSTTARVIDVNPFSRSSYPQPELTGLSFDVDGNLSIGLRDRSGDQIGRGVPFMVANPPVPRSQLSYAPFSMTGGDTLRATINLAGNLDTVQASPTANFAGWTLEPLSTSEFFHDDNFPLNPATAPPGVIYENDEISMGAVLQAPGFNETMMTGFDPIRDFNRVNGGGFRWFSNADGTVSRTYELYNTGNPAGNTSTFAKGNGLGDLLLITGAAPIEIGNFVWNDANRNGIQDAGEAGLANVSIDLYDGTTKIATAITDTFGNYIFSSGAGTSSGSRIYGLALKADSDYQLKVSPVQSSLNGLAFTVAMNDSSANGTARDSNASAAGIVNVHTGTLGESNHSFDIGLAKAATVSLGDLVWNDLNNDGRKQTSEPGLDGVVVNLLTSAGTFISSTTTANGGQYLFSGLSAGSYKVEIIPPAKYVSSTGKPGSDNGPFEPATFNSINSEDQGSNQSDGRIRSTVITLSASGDPANPDTIDGVPNSSNLRVDFGLIRPLSIGNLVWNDLNNDGIAQDSEPGLAGVTLNLIDDATSAIVASTTTNTSGGYLFSNLIEGRYRVEIPFSSLPDSRFRSSTGANADVGPFELGNYRDQDSNDQGIMVGAIVRGPTINLNYNTQPVGETPTRGGLTDNAFDADSNLQLDFGFFRKLRLGNLVFVDGNNNGVRDGNEVGFGPGLTVTLISPGQANQTTTTDVNGEYYFDNLFPGSYSVRVSGFPVINANTSWRSSSGAGIDDNKGKVNINAGPFEPVPQRATVNDQDNGTETLIANSNTNIRVRRIDYLESPVVTLGAAGSNPDLAGFANFSIDFGVFPYTPTRDRPAEVALSGYVFKDVYIADGKRERDANGNPLQGETGIGNVLVTLTGTDFEGNPVLLTTRTRRDGFYEFGVEPGTYTITETQPAQFYDSGESVGNLGGTNPANDVLTVVINENDPAGIEYDFGEIPAAAIFGYVYVDGNSNRRFDVGEVGIPNVTITLSGTAFAGTPMAQPITSLLSLNGLVTRTDAFGRWEFPFLPPGSYTIVETQPANYSDFFESDQGPIVRPVSIGNDVFTAAEVKAEESRGPLNFGELRRDNSKTEFLGSSNSTNPSTSPPVSQDPGNVNLNPSYSTNTTASSAPAFVVTAAGAGRSPLVRVFDYGSSSERFRFFAYEENYTGGVRVATADVNGDGTPDIIAATGQGGGPRIRVFNGLDGSIIKDFFAFETNFRGGVFVAAADVDGDGLADILAGTELGGGPRLRVFSGADGHILGDFFAFDSNQRGGLRVAAGDFNNDGKADLVATAGRGNQTRVRVFDAATLAPGSTPALLTDFVPYDTRFTGGVFVAAGDLDGDGFAEVVTSADVGGGPHVQVFNKDGVSLKSFFAVDPNDRGGIRVGVEDVTGDGKAEIVTGTGPGGPAHIRVIQYSDLNPVDDFYAFDGAYTGGVYVG